MHVLIVRLRDNTTINFGPFPTYFRANEYAKVLVKAMMDTHTPYVGHSIQKLTVPHNVKLNWR